MSTRRPVAVVVGATSKWQADGRNTKLAHGKTLDDRDVPVGIRWGVGGAVAQKFAKEGFHVVLTTRSAPNAKALDEAIRAQGGVRLEDGTTIVPEPILVGRSEERLRAIAERHGLERWTTSLDEVLADPEVDVYFDTQVTSARDPRIMQFAVRLSF